MDVTRKQVKQGQREERRAYTYTVLSYEWNANRSTFHQPSLKVVLRASVAPARLTRCRECRFTGSNSLVASNTSIHDLSRRKRAWKALERILERNAGNLVRERLRARPSRDIDLPRNGGPIERFCFNLRANLEQGLLYEFLEIAGA